MPGVHSRTRTDLPRTSRKSRNKCRGGSRSAASWRTTGTRSTWTTYSRPTTSLPRTCLGCSSEPTSGSRHRVEEWGKGCVCVLYEYLDLGLELLASRSMCTTRIISHNSHLLAVLQNATGSSVLPVLTMYQSFSLIAESNEIFGCRFALKSPTTDPVWYLRCSLFVLPGPAGVDYVLQ